MAYNSVVDRNGDKVTVATWPLVAFFGDLDSAAAQVASLHGLLLDANKEIDRLQKSMSILDEWLLEEQGAADKEIERLQTELDTMTAEVTNYCAGYRETIRKLQREVAELYDRT